MFETTGSSEELPLRAFRAGNNEVVGGSDRIDETGMDLSISKNKESRKSIHMPNIGATRKPNFLTSNAKKTFNYSKLALIKTPIL